MRLAIAKIELTHVAAALMLIALVVFSVRALRVTSDEGGTGTENPEEAADGPAEPGRYQIVHTSWRRPAAGEAAPAEVTPPPTAAELAEQARLQKIGEDLQGIPVAVERQ